MLGSVRACSGVRPLVRSRCRPVYLGVRERAKAGFNQGDETWRPSSSSWPGEVRWAAELPRDVDAKDVLMDVLGCLGHGLALRATATRRSRSSAKAQTRAGL